LLVVTGAGISSDSGIPTFRGPEGYFTVGSREYRPEELATAQAFFAHPREVWHWYLYRRSVCRRAVPNRGHAALVEAEQIMGDRFVLITQNVDGLHLRAGSSAERTLQIHGNIDFMRCARGCNQDLTPIPDEVGAFTRDTAVQDAAMALLSCPTCGSLARPHVLWFDEYYDEHLFRFDSSLGAAARADVVITVGSTGTTTLPHLVVDAALARRVPLIDINPDDNPFAAKALHSGGAAVRRSASDALPQLLARFA
jgi:NAD-dependent deacetylase